MNTKEGSYKGEVSLSVFLSEFVIQHHFKNHQDIHFDFMIRWEDSLLTWSLQKLPTMEEPIQIGQKIFNHRLKYLDFEGEIGRGLGFCKIWDKGKCWILEWQEGKMGKFLVCGRKDSQLWQLDRKDGNLWKIHTFFRVKAEEILNTTQSFIQG
ncbi:MAG: hypothetical protein D6785_02165 [Planctomycetota bacterium]|nr:MAG: hypothetical protein D6785_02165 [Planctomycetota bacterium]